MILLLFGWLALQYVYPHVEPYVSSPDAKLQALHQRLSTLHPRLASIPVYPGPVSETLDKNRIYICMRDPKTGNYYSDHMLSHVLLHEYAHILCNEYHDTPQTQHSRKFQLIFKTLRDDATRRGLYDPSIPLVKNYCGVQG